MATNTTVQQNQAAVEQPTPTPQAEEQSHESTADHIRHTTPWKIHIYVANYPLSSCIFFFLWFVICGIIVLSVPGLLAMSTQVPFYDRNNIARTYQDALTVGKNDATWTFTSGTESQIQQQQDAAGVTLTMLYKIKDGNTLATKDRLQIIDEIENTIKATKDYEQHCLKIYSDDNEGTCSRQMSITNLFDPNYFKPSVDANYTLSPSFIPNFRDYLLQSLLMNPTAELVNKNYDEAHIDSIVSYWAAYDKGDFENSSDTYGQKYYKHEAMSPKFYYISAPSGDTIYYVSNMMASIVDQNFGHSTPLDTDIEVSMSMFYFGLPLSGYDNSLELVDEQQDDIGKWCYDELHSIFIDLAKQYEDDIEIYWSCSTMAMHYTKVVLYSDMFFMIVTFLCVYLLMINNTGSVWLASWGMLMIFMNFLPSLLLYRYITQQVYFGTLQMMAMFIILSIGADDIFVICDTYAQYRTAAPDEPIDKRLTATLKHAGKVMATTSLSTCCSFIANTTSVFPAVYTFGLFSAWLIIVNYCAVVVFYPTVLAVHETYFFIPHLKRSCCMYKTCVSDAQCETCCGTANVKDQESEMRGIDSFFEFTFYPLIERNKKRILAVTLVVFLVFFGFGSKIKADPEPPQFYPNGNNYQEYLNVLTDSFSSETGTQLEVDIVWGIDGINREGTEPTVTDDMGEVIYGANLSFVAANEQQYIAQFCDDLLCLFGDYSCRYSPNRYYDLKISDPDNYVTNVVKCFMTEFREWVLADPMAFPNDSDIAQLITEYNLENVVDISDFDDCEYGLFPVEGEKCFLLLFSLLWVNEEMPTSNPDYVAGRTNYEYWKGYIYGKEGELSGVPDLKFFIVTVLTEASIETTPVDGIQLFEDWQTFGDVWRDNVDGYNSYDRYGDDYVETPKTLESIMITDGFLFSYFYVQRQIISEALFGIGLSLLLAFIILSIATGNWLIALYSCSVIFIIVICVIGFTVMNGWKLGVIEAVIYVMVVGMSVDYVVHLSEAYLASRQHYRKDRARRMLGIVGGSVLSGAVSTLLGIVWLLGATNKVFYKFGAFILCTIGASLIMSMVAFTAAMSWFGPEGSSGKLLLCLNSCRGCVSRTRSQSNRERHSFEHLGLGTEMP